MKYLVTGCAGFIGSHIVERLLEGGHEVTGIDTFSSYYAESVKRGNISQAQRSRNFQLIEQDINQLSNLKELVTDVDFIIHEAAQPGVRSSWGPTFSEYVEKNIMATQRLLEACRDAAVKKVVLASSSSVYGSAATKPLTENDPTNPESPYGVTKLAMEKLALAYHMNFATPVVLLRYFTVYGPRQRPDMAMHKFIKSILTSKKITVYGDGTQKRDFTYVADACTATIKAAEKAGPGSILNIGGGMSVMLKDVIKIIEEVAGASFQIEYDSVQKGDVRNTISDISKAKNMIDYNPSFNLRKGIEQQYLWMKNTMG